MISTHQRLMMQIKKPFHNVTHTPYIKCRCNIQGPDESVHCAMTKTPDSKKQPPLSFLLIPMTFDDTASQVEKTSQPRIQTGTSRGQTADANGFTDCLEKQKATSAKLMTNQTHQNHTQKEASSRSARLSIHTQPSSGTMMTRDLVCNQKSNTTASISHNHALQQT